MHPNKPLFPLKPRVICCQCFARAFIGRHNKLSPRSNVCFLGNVRIKKIIVANSTDKKDVHYRRCDLGGFLIFSKAFTLLR